MYMIGGGPKGKSYFTTLNFLSTMHLDFGNIPSTKNEQKQNKIICSFDCNHHWFVCNQKQKEAVNLQDMRDLTELRWPTPPIDQLIWSSITAVKDQYISQLDLIKEKCREVLHKMIIVS